MRFRGFGPVVSRRLFEVLDSDGRGGINYKEYACCCYLALLGKGTKEEILRCKICYVHCVIHPRLNSFWCSGLQHVGSCRRRVHYQAELQTNVDGQYLKWRLD
jgi:hypothetical protein